MKLPVPYTVGLYALQIAKLTVGIVVGRPVIHQAMGVIIALIPGMNHIQFDCTNSYLMMIYFNISTRFGVKNKIKFYIMLQICPK